MSQAHLLGLGKDEKLPIDRFTDQVTTGEILMNALHRFAKRLENTQILQVGKKLQINNLNICNSCSSWQFDYAHSKSQNIDISTLAGKTGLCFGVGGDAYHTQSDGSCSNWVPVF
jgi:hypothetical protein